MAETADEIFSITKANAALASSYDDVSDSLIKSLNNSKAWNFVSRMTSGSGFWKIQNKVRAVTDAYVIMDKAMVESIKTQNEAAETMQKLKKAQEAMPKRLGPDGGFKPEDLRNTEEFKSQRKTYIKAFGAKEGVESAEARLLADIEKSLVNNEEIMADLEGKQIDALRYQAMGWRLDKKLAFKTLKFMKLVGGIVKMAGKMLLSASIGFLMLIIFLPIAIKFVKHFRGYLEKFGVTLGVKDIKKAFRFVIDILKKLFDIVQLLMKGKFLEALKMYIFDVLIPIGRVLWKGVGVAIKILIALIGAIIDTMVQTMGEIWRTIRNFFSMDNLMGGLKVPQLKFMHTGGVSSGGMTVVGEKGPELVNLPAGARVHSNAESRRMGGNTINVNVNGRVGASDAEIRDIAQKVAREIGIQMNRTSSTVGRF